jgi:3-dehydroshikimate dehydratase
MIKTGLTSVTFRKLQPEEIIPLVKKAGLNGIEWGGDIHVPYGDLQRAGEVGRETRDAGLAVSSYGSYYRVGCSDNPVPFEQVLDTAVELQAPVIRVWAGDRGTEKADPTWWGQVKADGRRISGLAKQAGVHLAFEYHEETLTDSTMSACRLLREIDRENFKSYWQPPMDLEFTQRLASLQDISPWLSNIHVFHSASNRLLPLNQGEGEWLRYIEMIKAVPGNRYCLIEFVAGESADQFLEDAQSLRRICENQHSREE